MVFLMVSNNEPVCGHEHHNADKGLTLKAYWAAGAPLLEVGSTALVYQTPKEAQHKASTWVDSPSFDHFCSVSFFWALSSPFEPCFQT